MDGDMVLDQELEKNALFDPILDLGGNSQPHLVDEILDQADSTTETEIKNGTNEIEENSENASSPKKRLPRGASPPALMLEEATKIIHSFYEDAGGEASYDALSRILGNTSSSSTFLKKMSALRNFGLIEGENRTVKLSEIGYSIVAPRLPEEKFSALKKAFLSIEFFDKIYSKFAGRILPQDEFLVNSFKDYVPRELSNEWMQIFKESALFADLFLVRDDGKYQVKEGVGGDVKKVEFKNEKISEEEPKPKKKEVENETPHLPLVNPQTRVKTNYEFLIEILNPDMKKEEQDAVWTLIQYLKMRETKVT